MSATRLDNANIGESYIDEITSKNLIKIGHNNIGLTNMDTTDEPAIEATSSLEVDGTIYVWDEEESITGDLTDIEDTVYIRTDIDANEDLSLVYDSTITELPDWSYLKKGYYTDDGDKIVGSFTYSDSASTYSDKEFHL